jgi:pilus assembly protein CpaB
MNGRRITTALLIELVVSGLCTYALSRKISHPANKVPQRMYVAPSRPLQAGVVLAASDVELVGWPMSNPVEGAFLKKEDVVGRSLLYPIDKGQLITDKILSASGSGMGLAGKIPDGMRAIALRSDEVVGVAGFLSPGSHLDVLVTYRSDKSPEPTTMTVLQNAEVLATGHQVQPDPEGKPAPVTVVTLLLKPEDAERAVLASTQGTIHFVLRSGSDKAIAHETPIMLSQLGGTPSDAPAPAAAPHVSTVRAPHHAAPTFVVETIMGDKESTAKFTGDIQQ